MKFNKDLFNKKNKKENKDENLDLQIDEDFGNMDEIEEFDIESLKDPAQSALQNSKDLEEDELSLEALEDDFDLEQISDNEVSLEQMSMEGSEKLSPLDEVNNFRIKSSENRRREHLSAKEDYLQRKREASQAKAKRRLINGGITALLLALFVGGIYTAFPRQVFELIDSSKEGTRILFGGIYNKDIEKKVNDDIQKRFGDSDNTLLSNLAEDKEQDIEKLGLEFEQVEFDKKDDLKKTNDKIKEGNYIVGKGLPQGLFFGQNVEIDYFKSFEDLKNNEVSESDTIENDLFRLSDGQIIRINKKEILVPNDKREPNFIKANKIENDKMYYVGKDIEQGTYNIDVANKGKVTIIDDFNIQDVKNIKDFAEIKLVNGDLVLFEQTTKLRPIK